MKFKVDSSQDENTKNSFAEKLKSFDILPQNCALINSSNFQDRLTGVIFFRRVLAVDKKPPIDLIIELECVIPALIQCLYEVNVDKLQVEATWCLTNISCGEAHHITHLLDCNIMQALMTVISKTNHNTVREQAIWAVNNLSSDDRVCHIIITDSAILSCLLYQVGVEFVALEDSKSYTYRHRTMNDNPALSTMRHIAFICGNLIKSKSQLSVACVSSILFTLADLLQSPDDEIILDICQSIAFCCAQYGDWGINLILEEGILSRLIELLDVPSFQELSLVALCGIARSPLSLHRKLVLHKFVCNNSVSNDFCYNVCKKSFVGWCRDVLAKTTNPIIIKDIVGGLIAAAELNSSMYLEELWKLESMNLFYNICSNNIRDVRIDIGNILFQLYGSERIIPTASPEVFRKLLDTVLILLDENDAKVLFQLLILLEQTISLCVDNRLEILHYGEFDSRLDALSLNPNTAVSDQSRKVEEQLREYFGHVFPIDS